MRKIGFSLTLCILLSLSLLLGANPLLANTGDQGERLHLNGLIPETATDSTKIELENGMTKPIYSTDDAIIEHLFVETTVDSDRDGELDRVAIEVMRPNTEPGVKVPVIFEMSPYRGGSNPINYYNIHHELYAVGQDDNLVELFATGERAEAGVLAANLGSYGNYYIPRGYAVILGYSLGAGGSTGCPTTGGENEILGTKAVIDWLNDRARAFTEDGQEVTADWSSGMLIC